MAATDLLPESVGQALALAVAADVKAIAVLLNNNQSDLSALTTTAKTSVVAAINELDLLIESLSGGGGASSLDDLTDVAITGSATGHILRHNGTAYVNVLGTDYFVTPAMLSSAIDDVISAAPGTLDTLQELANALNNDPNFFTTIQTALTGKQNVDALLTAIAGLSTSNNQMMYFTGTDTVGLTTLSVFARTLLDDGDAATARATLGVVASSADLAAYYTAARA